jgi:hypothetical protein
MVTVFTAITIEWVTISTVTVFTVITVEWVTIFTVISIK